MRSGASSRMWARKARTEASTRSGLSELRSCGSACVATPRPCRACSKKVPLSPPMRAEKRTWPRKARHSSITWLCAPPISPLVMTSRTCKGAGLLVSIRVARLPAPGVCTHALHAQLRLPAQLTFGQCGVGAQRGHIAGAAVCKLVGHVHTIDPRKGVGQFLDAHAVPGAQVDGDALLLVLQIAQRSQVALRQVDHVDVVAHAGAVGRGVVAAE